MTPLRILTAFALPLTLAACAGGTPEVRQGPQEVHPAPPAVQHFDNQGCHSHGHKGCHNHPHDGATPFVNH
jgi:hypothetical protein